MRVNSYVANYVYPQLCTKQIQGASYENYNQISMKKRELTIAKTSTNYTPEFKENIIQIPMEMTSK